MLKAVQVIALSMTALDVLAEAQTADFSPSMRIRCRGYANALNRSALRTENALGLRSTSEPHPAPEQFPEPVNGVPEAEPRAGVDTHRNPVSSIRQLIGTHPTIQDDRNKQPWAGAIADALQQMRRQVQPALSR